MISLSIHSGLEEDPTHTCEISSHLAIRLIRDHSLSQIHNRIPSRRTRPRRHISICQDHPTTSTNDPSCPTEAPLTSSISITRTRTIWSSWKKDMTRNKEKREEEMRTIRNLCMSMPSNTTGSSRGEQQGRDWRNSTGWSDHARYVPMVLFCKTTSIRRKTSLISQPYLHESRHRHACSRPRGKGGRFLTAEEIEALKKEETAKAAEGETQAESTETSVSS
jgi:hypothetical protein